MLLLRQQYISLTIEFMLSIMQCAFIWFYMYRLFKIIFLFITLFIFFPFQFVCSAQSLEQLKPEIRNNRKTHINGITSPINRIKYCDEKLNALSLAVTDVTEYISENNSLCEFIYIEMQLEQCLQSNSELLADVKSIISTISGIKITVLHLLADNSLERKKSIWILQLN